MLRLFLLIAFASLPFFGFAENFYDLEAHGYEQYQDVIVNGSVYKKANGGNRYLERRFAIVDSVLTQYKRPFTMLDIGAAQGYFSLRAAALYPDSVFVMLEGSNTNYPEISKQLDSICKLNTSIDNLVWLNTSIHPDDFTRLSACEHFDVILLLNIVHWFPNDWKQMIDTANKMSHCTILEVPPVQKEYDQKTNKLREDIHTYLTKIAKKKLQGVPRHTDESQYTTYYILENNEPHLLSRTTMIHPFFGDREHKVVCDFENKQFIKTDNCPPHRCYTSNWVPGINYMTYAMLNGAYPSRNTIIENLPINYTHKDWTLNNMVIQGDKLSLIDFDDAKLKDSPVGNKYTEQRYERFKKLILTKDADVFKRDFFLIWDINIDELEDSF